MPPIGTSGQERRDPRPGGPYTRGIDPLSAAIEALSRPLGDDERRHGWTDRSQEHWLAYLDGLRQGIRVATYPERAAVLDQLTRWLDHDGIDAASPLAGLFAEAQKYLGERFASPRY